MSAPSPNATYERARRIASDALWAIALQRRRLRTTEPEDGEFVLRRWADFQFLIVGLIRFRRAAILATKVPVIADEIRAALKRFDDALPMLKNMRDVAEHFDDYAMDNGKVQSISRGSLEVGVVGDTLFQRLGYELNADDAVKAAYQLFQGIKDAKATILAAPT